MPGKENTIADCLSRWAYPAGKAYKDVSKHGSKEEDQVMREFIQQEKLEEKSCLLVLAKRQPTDLQVRPVNTLPSSNQDFQFKPPRTTPAMRSRHGCEGKEASENPAGITHTTHGCQNPNRLGTLGLGLRIPCMRCLGTNVFPHVRD